MLYIKLCNTKDKQKEFLQKILMKNTQNDIFHVFIQKRRNQEN